MPLHLIRSAEIRHSDQSPQLDVDLLYPSVPSDPGEPVRLRYVVFDQSSVRASDGIRISYDYDRDGYVIEQASKFSWPVTDTECDRDWQEVSFIQAWGREESEEDANRRCFGERS